MQTERYMFKTLGRKNNLHLDQLYILSLLTQILMHLSSKITITFLHSMQQFTINPLSC